AALNGTAGMNCRGRSIPDGRGADSVRDMRLYSDLAHWWPVFSPPIHYVEEAADLLPTLLAAPDAPPETMLELGSGGGSLAFHFKHRLRLTLSDRSPEM